MNPKSLAAKISKELRAVGRGSRQGHRPSNEPDYGVYTQDLRKIVRDNKKRLAAEDGESVYQLAIALLAQRNYECRMVAYELVAAHKEARESLNLRRLERLGKGLDNWATVDAFCCGLAGQIWREGQITDAAIKKWARSKGLWWRRAAVVATVPLNIKSRGGTGDAPKTLMICEMVIDDTEEIVQKAVSWSLRELAEREPDAVKKFLAKHGDRVSSRVKREVLRKLKTGKKN